MAKEFNFHYDRVVVLKESSVKIHNILINDILDFLFVKHVPQVSSDADYMTPAFIWSIVIRLFSIGFFPFYQMTITEN